MQAMGGTLPAGLEHHTTLELYLRTLQAAGGGYPLDGSHQVRRPARAARAAPAARHGVAGVEAGRARGAGGRRPRAGFRGGSAAGDGGRRGGGHGGGGEAQVAPTARGFGQVQGAWAPAFRSPPQSAARRYPNPGACAAAQVVGCESVMAAGVDPQNTLRYRICVKHLRAEEVIWKGESHRWCQKCCRMHPLAEYDGKAHTCRPQVEKNTLRRRKAAESRSGVAPDKAAAAAADCAAADYGPGFGGEQAAHEYAAHALEVALEGQHDDGLDE